MPNALTFDGLTTATQAELLEFFTTAAEDIYGNDIVLTSDTPDGQWINIFIQAVLDVEDLLTQVYNSFNPDTAIGRVLDQRVAINGIQRQGGTYTITNVTLVNAISVNLLGLDQSAEAPYTISDAAGNQFFLITSSLGLAPGTHVLIFRAATPGAQVTVANTITVAVTTVLGVTSVNNPTSYTTLGIDEESDASLRVRRQRSVAISSQGYLKGLLAALQNINGISAVRVYENDTSGISDGSVPGVPPGIPAHSIWVVVQGTPTPDLAPAWSAVTEYSYGSIVSDTGVNYFSIQDGNLNNLVSDTSFWSVYSPIAQAIYAKRNAGCGMKGAISYTIVQIDGVPFLVYWDVVTAEDLYIKFTAGSLNKLSPPNIAAIREGLVTGFVPEIFEEVDINRLGTAVQAIDPNTFITSAGFSTSAPGSYTPTLTPTTADKQFAVGDTRNIILPMILAGDAGAAPGIQYNIDPTTGQVLNTTLTIAAGGTTYLFHGYGGYGTNVYTVLSGGGSIDSGTGIYTSGVAGTDVVQVEDDLGNTATCTVTVA